MHTLTIDRNSYCEKCAGKSEGSSRDPVDIWIRLHNPRASIVDRTNKSAMYQGSDVECTQRQNGQWCIQPGHTVCCTTAAHNSALHTPILLLSTQAIDCRRRLSSVSVA